MTEVTPADASLYLLRAPPPCQGSSSHPLPWDITPRPRSCGEHLSMTCAAPQILFLGKRGRKTATCSFPAFPRAGGLVQEPGTNRHKYMQGVRGAGSSRGFARLLQHRSRSRLCSGSPQRGCGCSDDGTGVPSSQRDALALQH